MGLLDDAIREHLELKRRRGADAEEVTRLEQEALGPPRRGEFAGATAPVEPADVAGEPPAPPEDAAWLDDEPAPVAEPEEPQEVVLDQPTAEYTPPSDPAQPEPGDDVLEET